MPLEIRSFPAEASQWVGEAERIDALCFGSADAWDRHAFLAERPDKWHLSRAACFDTGLVGFAIAFRWARHVAHLSRIGVDPAFRGQHAGERLLDAIWQSATALGCEAVTLEFHNDLPVAGFYERCGYRELRASELDTYLDLKGKAQRAALYSPTGRRVFLRSESTGFRLGSVGKEELLG